MAIRDLVFLHLFMTTLFASFVLAGTSGFSGKSANAQSLSWFVYANCNANPCVIGVAEFSYSVPNNQRYREGWRKHSGGYNNARQAWRAACRMYYTGRFNVPGIYQGRVNCAALGVTSP